MSLAMAGGASAAVAPAANEPSQKTTPPVITLGEEELSDVSLATFYVFDRESTLPSSLGEKVAARCGGCRGCGGGGRCAAARCAAARCAAARCAAARCAAGRCAVARCGARCAVGRCAVGRCGVGVVGCGGCGCSCSGCSAPCWTWSGAGWVYVC